MCSGLRHHHAYHERLLRALIGRATHDVHGREDETDVGCTSNSTDNNPCLNATRTYSHPLSTSHSPPLSTSHSHPHSTPHSHPTAHSPPLSPTHSHSHSTSRSTSGSETHDQKSERLQSLARSKRSRKEFQTQNHFADDCHPGGESEVIRKAIESFRQEQQRIFSSRRRLTNVCLAFHR